MQITEEFKFNLCWVHSEDSSAGGEVARVWSWPLISI